jgi:hypothetical protein
MGRGDYTLEESPLEFSYPCYKDMFDNNIIFAYRGIVTSDLVTHVLEIMEERLEEDGQTRKLSRKVSNVMVECLTNVYVDEVNIGDNGYDPTAMLLVKKVNKSYSVVTGSYLPNNKVAVVKKLLDRINDMNSEELRMYYQQTLTAEDPSTVGMSMLGVIDLARKSKHKLEYQFKFENENYTYFTLEARISKYSL